jgi:hypothetical protein
MNESLLRVVWVCHDSFFVVVNYIPEVYSLLFGTRHRRKPPTTPDISLHTGVALSRWNF